MTNRRMPWDTAAPKDERAEALLNRMGEEADGYDRQAGEAKRKADALTAWVQADDRRVLTGEQLEYRGRMVGLSKGYTDAAISIRLLMAQARAVLGVR